MEPVDQAPCWLPSFKIPLEAVGKGKEKVKKTASLGVVQFCAPRIYNLTLCGGCYCFFRNVPHSPGYVLNGHEAEQSEGQGNLHFMGSQKAGHDLASEQ